MSAWDDYMKEHGKEEYAAWKGAIKPMTDEIARLQRELDAEKRECDMLRLSCEALREKLAASEVSRNSAVDNACKLVDENFDLREKLAARGSSVGLTVIGIDTTWACEKCGVLLSQAEGGNVFTICDTCWDDENSASKEGKP